jgi:hypothetical protein
MTPYNSDERCFSPTDHSESLERRDAFEAPPGNWIACSTN